MIEPARVLGALSAVRDPELDQSITELGFVSGIEIDGDTVAVRLRLPTYFCAANFAYLMAGDARAAVLALPGVGEARIALDDHFASGEINDAMGQGKSFQEAFPGQAEGGLDELRNLFRRKGFTARQQKLCRALLDEGRTPADLSVMRLGDLEPSPEVQIYIERRRELGLDVSPDAPFVVDAGGTPVRAEALEEHLRFARLVGVSIEANAGLCRGLLATRYGIPDPEEVAAT